MKNKILTLKTIKPELLRNYDEAEQNFLAVSILIIMILTSIIENIWK